MRRSQLLFQADMRPTDTFACFLRDIQIPGHDLITIDNALQARFFQQGPDGRPLERRELKTVELTCPLDRIHQHLAACGFWHETKPSSGSYAYAAWPGALALRAAARLADLIQAWLSGVYWPETVAFGSQRPLHPDKENYERCCQVLSIHPENNMAHLLWRDINPQTELDLMRWIWANFPHPARGGRAALILQDVTFVNAPMKPPLKPGGPPVRPNTEDTIQEWLRSNPSPGSMLLSSGAPYGMAQDEAFWLLLEPHGHTVETFGHAAPDRNLHARSRRLRQPHQKSPPWLLTVHSFILFASLSPTREASFLSSESVP